MLAGYHDNSSQIKPHAGIFAGFIPARCIAFIRVHSCPFVVSRSCVSDSLPPPFALYCRMLSPKFLPPNGTENASISAVFVLNRPFTVTSDVLDRSSPGNAGAYWREWLTV